MRVLLTGANGQLGKALIASCPREIDLIACRRVELDLGDPLACKCVVERHHPDWVLNAGAYTNVDKAELEKELANAVNADAPAALSSALADIGGRMLQVSTDFVFDGTQNIPYVPHHPVCPLGVYGSTKADGEKAVLNSLGERAYVIRTSWLYGPVGKNFLLTMLRLHETKAALGESLKVVSDQIGCPTSTSGLAKACWQIIKCVSLSQPSLTNSNTFSQIFHWSDAGRASWFDFAQLIGTIAVMKGLLVEKADVQPISTVDYPTPASRPHFSLLDCSSTYEVLGMTPVHWSLSLEQVISELCL